MKTILICLFSALFFWILPLLSSALQPQTLASRRLSFTLMFLCWVYCDVTVIEGHRDWTLSKIRIPRKQQSAVLNLGLERHLSEKYCCCMYTCAFDSTCFHPELGPLALAPCFRSERHPLGEPHLISFRKTCFTHLKMIEFGIGKKKKLHMNSCSE